MSVSDLDLDFDELDLSGKFFRKFFCIKDQRFKVALQILYCTKWRPLNTFNLVLRTNTVNFYINLN